MKPKYDLQIFKNGKIVALQDITNWSLKQVGELWLFQEEDQGRTCQIKRVENNKP